MMKRLDFFPSLLFTLSFIACQDEAEPPTPATPAVLMPRELGASVAYDKVWQIGTHNSFWAERQGGDPYASGPKERILDQLLADRARSLEFDLHRGVAPHSFRIYHGIPGDSLCDSFEECLAIVRMFHRTMPQHHPIVILLEFKELFQEFFDDSYTPEDLDRVLSAELGALLYRPADFLKPCAAVGITSLLECHSRIGWPSLAELRGRVIVSTLASWDRLGGLNSAALVRYAAAPDISARAAFPMIASWQHEFGQLDPAVQERVTDAELRAAHAQSLFFQSGGPSDEQAWRAVAEGRLVRMEASSVEVQQQVLAQGAQLIQTGTPWIRYDNGRPELSVQAFSTEISIEALREPQNRLLLPQNTNDPQQSVFASTQVAAESSTTWETVVSVGLAPQRVGCLRAAQDPSSSDMSVTLCRHLLPSDQGPDSVGQVLRLTVCAASGCTPFSYRTEDGSPGGSGELIALDVALSGGQSCVRARAARLVDVALQPLWTPLGDKHCLPALLRHQGLARPGLPTTTTSDEPVYFFDTRRDGAPISAADLTIR